MSKNVKKSDPINAQKMAENIQNILNYGYESRHQALWFTFLKGLVSGVGAFLGGTLVIGLIIWILSLFDTLPIVQTILENLNSR